MLGVRSRGWWSHRQPTSETSRVWHVGHIAYPTTPHVAHCSLFQVGHKSALGASGGGNQPQTTNNQPQTTQSPTFSYAPHPAWMSLNIDRSNSVPLFSSLACPPLLPTAAANASPRALGVWVELHADAGDVVAVVPLVPSAAEHLDNPAGNS